MARENCHGQSHHPCNYDFLVGRVEGTGLSDGERMDDLYQGIGRQQADVRQFLWSDSSARREWGETDRYFNAQIHFDQVASPLRLGKGGTAAPRNASGNVYHQ